MKRMFPAATAAFAAVALYATAASAEGGFSGTSRSHQAVGRQERPFSCFGMSGGTNVIVGDRMGNHRRRDARSVCNSDVVMDVYGGEWALYNNRTWDSDSYNDWWHDRPDRAYPAWMRHNEGCQRMWFAGDTLRC